MKRIWSSFKIAFAMYSKIPMPQSDWTEENMSLAMCFFPWVGMVIGLVTWGVFQLKVWTSEFGIQYSDLFWTILLLLIPIFITGGIHMDGFLDTKDAMSSYQPMERRLEILKDSHAGAFAIISCSVYLLAYLGIYSCLTESSVRVIGLSFILSRTFSGLSVICFPQARKKGMVATFAQNAAKQLTKRILIIYLSLLVPGMILVGGILGICALLTAGLMFLYYYHMSRKHFGGVTGDLAGYFLQMCEILMALVVVVANGILGGLGL